MNYKRKETSVQPAPPVALHEHATAERCRCQPLSSIQAIPLHEQDEDEDEMDCDKITPATPELTTSIRMQLSNFFPRSTALSILLLHVSQLEHIHIAPQTAILHKRLRYHAPASFLEQVLANMRRTIRENDQILTHKGVGAAIIFPDVDQQGIFDILERVYRNVSLLQAETVIPPLKRETDIVMGIGSFPEAGPSLEHLLHQVSLTARRFTLRPAITTQLWNRTPNNSEHSEEEAAATSSQFQDTYDVTQTAPRLGKVHSNIPYMQLPVQLPSRLKQLIPYQVANELHCAPVGRDHHCLTVAMVDPTNDAIIHTLRDLTGLTIYPVSCDITALNALLANKW
ncbi:MAG: hypothetical protein ABI396_00370 [Ktedonobacteraceae bacterium]